MPKSRVLVTGGGGFIGSHLVDRLLASGHSVIALDDFSTSTPSNLVFAQTFPSFRLIHGDAGNTPLMADLCSQVDEIYHLAAAVGVALVNARPVEAMYRNLEPTRVVLSEAARQHGLGKPLRVFLASSSEVYGRNPKASWSEEDDLVYGPTSRTRWSYGMSKAIDESLALGWWKMTGLPVVIGRFFNVAGPRQTGAYGMVLPRFVNAALRNEPLVVHGDGSQTRCFAHVSDVVSAVIQIMRTESARGEIFNIGSDQPITIQSLAEEVIAVTNSQSIVRFISYQEAFDANFEDVLHRVPILDKLRAATNWHTKYSLPDIIRDVAANCMK